MLPASAAYVRAALRSTCPLHGRTPAAADQDFSLPGLARFLEFLSDDARRPAEVRAKANRKRFSQLFECASGFHERAAIKVSPRSRCQHFERS